MKRMSSYLILSFGITLLLVGWLMPTTMFSDEHGQEIQFISGKTILVSEMDQFIIETMDSLQIPGVSIGLINNGELAYHRSFGVSNKETKRAISDQSLFEAASLSKPLFAYFALKMVEQKVIDLDQPVYTYLPHPAIKEEFKETYKLITPRMILSHSTGFPNWSHGKKIELSHLPGRGYSYSGEAYQYLAAIIGQRLNVGWENKLDSVFQDVVAKPLGMTNSWFTWNDSITAHKVFGHQNGKPVDPMTHGKSFGAGYSLHSEAVDYSKFLIEMMKPKHINRTFIDEILKEQNHFSDENELVSMGQTGWGLGFSRRPTQWGTRYQHTGNNHDFQSFCFFYKEKKYGLALFINSDNMEAFYEAFGTFIGDKI